MFNREIIKIPYSPTDNLRFEVSKDRFSRERLKTLLTTHRVLKDNIPFFAGMTAFGSLTKGKVLDDTTAEYADIDVMTFIDSDMLNETAEEFAENNDDFKMQLLVARSKLKHFSEQPSNFDIRLAGAEFVSKITRNLIYANISRDNNLVQVNNMTKIISHEGDDSIEEHVYVCAGMDDSVDSQTFATVAMGLAAPFFFDIGGGMASYRRKFMQQLQSHPPDVASEMWSIVLQAMMTFERKGEIPESISKFYPQTVFEASKFYGL